MRLTQVFWAVLAVAALGITGDRLRAQDLNAEAWRMETKGQATEARQHLQKAAAARPNDAAALEAYAEFLDRHRDPDARPAYQKLLQVLKQSNGPMAQRAVAARRLAILDLVAGDRQSAFRDLDEFRSAGGTGFSLAGVPPAAEAPEKSAYIQVPGPLRSFSRMAALSPDLQPEDLLSALARNVVTNGYQASNANEALEPTEYLKLVVRYLSQARELERLAGEKKVIHIEKCDSTETGDLLRVIGYRMRGGCGSDVILETVNASRAFLTIDSGFPLAELEQALRTDRPFTLDYHPTRVPVLYSADYWQSVKDKTNGDFIDYFISDPSLCRLYLGLSKLDPETAAALKEQIPAARLKIWAHV